VLEEVRDSVLKAHRRARVMPSPGRDGWIWANIMFKPGFIGPSEPNASGMPAATSDRSGR